MDQETTKKYAIEKFKSLSEVEYEWNILHPEYMIRAIEELSKKLNVSFDIERLKVLAWIHDIGKIEDFKNHAEVGLKILEKDFELTDLDKDCILNPGKTSFTFVTMKPILLSFETSSSLPDDSIVPFIALPVRSLASYI